MALVESGGQFLRYSRNASEREPKQKTPNTDVGTQLFHAPRGHTTMEERTLPNSGGSAVDDQDRQDPQRDGSSSHYSSHPRQVGDGPIPIAPGDVYEDGIGGVPNHHSQ
jgi:hypothetical protein